MPLQNRVTPLGELVADPARGLVYGNRGCLHDAAGRIRRHYGVRRWILVPPRVQGLAAPEAAAAREVHRAVLSRQRRLHRVALDDVHDGAFVLARRTSSAARVCSAARQVATPRRHDGRAARTRR